MLFCGGCDRFDPPYVLNEAKSCADVEDEIKLQAMMQIQAEYAWHFNFGFGGSGNSIAEDASAPMGAAGASKSATPSRVHSDTNVQVKGVDEADLVETDGSYIFSLIGDHLVITKAWPAADSAELSRLKIEGSAEGIYLRAAERKIVMISTLYYRAPVPSSGQVSASLPTREPAVKVSVVDVSDPLQPVYERETYIQGTLSDSRLVDSRLIVVTYADLMIPDLYEATSKDTAMRAVRKATLSDWMPKRFDNIRSGGQWTSGDSDVCGCSDVLSSDRRSGTHLVTLSSMDVLDPTLPIDARSVLGQVNSVYANGRSFYILSQEDKEGPFRTYDDSVETIVHRFALAEGSGVPSYAASGKVPGWVLNQFSIDEYEGNLRLATTDQSSDFNQSVGLYILGPSGHELKLLGRVDPIVENESVYAVRYIANKAYVVTFRQIDPLFAIDLTDPRYPEVKGALEMPGFSNYLHPIDETHLLGIGMDNQWGGNVQISLFDVSNDQQPVLDSRLTLNDVGWSSAQTEHHAFNYFAPQEALFVPATSSATQQSEIHVINAKVGTPLSERGVVSNAPLRQAAGFAGSEYDYCVEQRRSVVIEDMLYAVSGAGILVTAAETPWRTVATVPFTGIDPCADQYGYGQRRDF